MRQPSTRTSTASRSTAARVTARAARARRRRAFAGKGSRGRIRSIRPMWRARLSTTMRSMVDTSTPTILLRPATADDDAELRRLSQLDSAAVLRRPAVLAEVDGMPIAALSLDEGRVVADPFRPTAGAVELLRAR